ncbi:hypothetical protein [Caulobacter sp.]|uniref:hypothetical protein n=1 Tax=Caulobacter sp. TaxID=78 RepID=UPI0031E35A92
MRHNHSDFADRPLPAWFNGRRYDRIAVGNSRLDGSVGISRGRDGAFIFESPEQVLKFATALAEAADYWASLPQSPTQNG